LFCRYGILFEKHCEEGGGARLGTKQRLQAMSDTVQAAVLDWLAQHPRATVEERVRLDLGYITYTVLLRALCCDFACIMFRKLILCLYCSRVL
jgi:hypothetical protein